MELIKEYIGNQRNTRKTKFLCKVTSTQIFGGVDINFKNKRAICNSHRGQNSNLKVTQNTEQIPRDTEYVYLKLPVLNRSFLCSGWGTFTSRLYKTTTSNHSFANCIEVVLISLKALEIWNVYASSRSISPTSDCQCILVVVGLFISPLSIGADITSTSRALHCYQF